MAVDQQAPPVRKRLPARRTDVLIMVVPLLALCAVGIMIWALQSNSEHRALHPSVGIFHSGETKTVNDVTGTVDLVVTPAPLGLNWHITLHLLDPHAQPITGAAVTAHGVESGRYLDQEPLAPGPEPGTWVGDIVLYPAAKSVMVHVTLSGHREESWVAEWKPKEGTVPGS